jgi:predicted Zn-dependent protease with MMP-like domain
MRCASNAGQGSRAATVVVRSPDGQHRPAPALVSCRPGPAGARRRAGSPYRAAMTARRDRHGRGLRAPLVRRRVEVAGRVVDVPAALTAAERFDELVRDAMEHLEESWGREFSPVELAVVDVPPGTRLDVALDPDLVVDETAGGAVLLGRLLRGGVDARGVEAPARVVVYRRPLEARAGSRAELGDLVRDVLVDCVARYLGLDPDDVDPPKD